MSRLLRLRGVASSGGAAGGAVHGGGLLDERMGALVEDGAAAGGVVAVEADDERFGQLDGFQGLDDAVGDRVAGGDAAEDVDEDGLHGRVGEDDGEAVGHDLGGGAAADVEEVGGAGAAAGDDVEGGHDQARAVADDADLAVELDVVEALGGGRRLQRVVVRRRSSAPQRACRKRALSSRVTLPSRARICPCRGADERVDLDEQRRPRGPAPPTAVRRTSAVCGGQPGRRGDLARPSPR